jgi:hypothetical protein
VQGAAERQRGDRGALVARAGHGDADGGERALDHGGRILLGLAVLGLEQRVAGLPAAQRAAVGVEGDRLHAGRPDVDAEDHVGGHGRCLTRAGSGVRGGG